MYDHIMNNMAELQDDIIKLSRSMAPKSYKVMSWESILDQISWKALMLMSGCWQGKALLNPDIHLSLWL